MAHGCASGLVDTSEFTSTCWIWGHQLESAAFNLEMRHLLHSCIALGINRRVLDEKGDIKDLGAKMIHSMLLVRSTSDLED